MSSFCVTLPEAFFSFLNEIYSHLDTVWQIFDMLSLYNLTYQYISTFQSHNCDWKVIENNDILSFINLVRQESSSML